MNKLCLCHYCYYCSRLGVNVPECSWNNELLYNDYISLCSVLTAHNQRTEVGEDEMALIVNNVYATSSTTDNMSRNGEWSAEE